MNKFLLFVFIIVILVLDDNLLTVIGYPHKDVDANIIFKVHPLTYLSVVTLIVFILNRKIKIKDLRRNFKVELYLCLFCLVLLLYLFFMGRFNSGSSPILDALFAPAILAILLRSTPIQNLKIFRSTIFFIFLLNSGLALFEKLMQMPLLSTDYMALFPDFRSTALFGHPLNNALIMSVLSIFLYFGSDKLIKKLIILLVSIVAVLCFGARGAIIGVVGGIFISITINLLKNNLKNNLKYILGIAVIFLAGYFLLLNTSLGDRILKQGSFENDKSALERVRTLELPNLMDNDQLQWGMDDSAVEILMKKGGVLIIENYLVVWITRFGIYLTLLLFFLLLRFVIKQIKYFDKVALFPILFTFLFVASTNNSLASKTRTISILVLCCYVLKKQDVYTLELASFD